MKMLFKLTENNEIFGYSSVLRSNQKNVILERYTEQSNQISEDDVVIEQIETGLVPSDFEEMFSGHGVGYFIYDGEKIIENENYIEPSEPGIEVEENVLTLDKVNEKVDDTAIAVAETVDMVLSNEENSLDAMEVITTQEEQIFNLQEEVKGLKEIVENLKNGGNE